LFDSRWSGYSKFSAGPHPFEDTWPFVRAIVEAFTLDRCLWASDWPFLRAPQRQDYGPLVELVELLFPNPADRQALLWNTPRRLFGFGDEPAG
jgi:predicted TIM-barrel fold metal-dependent hydrolase